MIKNLHVHGVGGIEDADMSFSGNFIAITGESGSGKSSLVRALEFITGKRAQVSNINAVENFSDVAMVIEPKNPETFAEFMKKGKEIKINRIFGRNGRGKLTINNTTLSVARLISMMSEEIVIQSQYAQLNLLDPAKQLELVDSFGGAELKESKAELKKTFDSTLSTERTLHELKNKRKELSEKYQNVEDIIRTITLLNLQPDTEQELENELTRLDRDSRKIQEILRLYTMLDGNDDECGLVSEIEKFSRLINDISINKNDPKKHCTEKMLEAAQELSAMLKKEFKGIIDSGSIEEAREMAEKKLGLLRKTKRVAKLNTCKELLDYAKEAKASALWLKNSLTELKELENNSEILKKKLSRDVQTLRQLRKAAAKSLEARVNENLNDMAMGFANFEINIVESKNVRINGAETAQFMLKMPDQEALPVDKTASGGELSRILIALQHALGDVELPETLIFDEVEAGLGGKSALLAGYKLKELSKKCRTILITHEATIAAMADQHFLVSRTKDTTNITEISGNDRVREIARMLSGDDRSPEALKHAKYLLDGE